MSNEERIAYALAITIYHIIYFPANAYTWLRRRWTWKVKVPYMLWKLEHMGRKHKRMRQAEKLKNLTHQ